MHLLLFEDNPGDARLMREYLAEAGTGRFQLTHVDRLSTGLERLADTSFDAVLVDLVLPDSEGLDTVVQIRAASKSLPIVVLTGVEDEELGMRLVQAGAQDYLVKGQVTGQMLMRSLRYAIERGRAERERRNSEFFLQSIVENIPDMIFVKDAETLRFMRFNRAGEELLGYTGTELIGKSDYDVFPKEEADFFTAKDHEVLRDGKIMDIPEEAILTKAKGLRFLRTKKIPILDEAGHPLYLLGISEDITERKRAEALLRTSQEKLRQALHASGTGLWDWNTVTNEVVLSREWKQQLGYKENEIPDAFDTWENRLHPDDHARALAYVRDYLAHPEREYQQEFRLRHKDGSYRWIEARASFVTEADGQRVRLIGSHTDITERKLAEAALRESEERFRAIMANSPSKIFIKDTEGRYLEASRRFVDTFKFRDSVSVTAKDLIGRTDEEIFSSEQAAAFRANDRKVLNAGVPMEFEEVEHHEDGYRTSLVVKFPLLNLQGQCYALCGIATDITERIKAEHRLQDTVERVRTLSHRLETVREEERTKIARELHDELGIRLTCLKLDLARLQSMMGGAIFPSEKMAEQVRAMAEQVDTTIAEVQRLSADLRPGVLDDLGLVAAIEWQCQDFEKRSGLRCSCQATQETIDLDSSCTTAAFRICQEALTNVVRHAKATFVRVLVAQVERELLVEIQDDGLGVPVEKLTDSASLGLLGMRERASSLGGQLDIVGRPGKGTTVTLRLPIANND